MSLIIKEEPKVYPLAPEGLFNAVCVDVVDLGHIETTFGQKHKCSLIFELEEEDETGQRFIVGKRYTVSLNEKASLRKELERWQGRAFTPEELKLGVDTEWFIGRSCKLFIAHRETQERTYANIETILPPDKRGKLPNWDQVIPSGAYTRVHLRDGYLEPDAYAKKMAELAA